MITQGQIARKLGVSRQLVTFALAGYPQISEKSRKRILEAARKMGYKPNPHARALRHGRTGIIALWIPNQISTHYAHVVRELSRTAKQSGQELVVSEVELGNPQILSHVPIDGIIGVDVGTEIENYMKLPVARNTPLISIGVDCTQKVDFVKVDLASGVKNAMAHLVKAGHKRIAHATWQCNEKSKGSRRQVYLESMAKAKLKPEFIHYPLSDQQRSITRQLIADYIRKNGCPDAIFCHSDDAAMGIYRGICDLKLRVPKDVALVGCDGIQDTEYLETPLTTLVQPVTQMCNTAWTFLSKRLDKPELKPQKTTFSAELVVRESSSVR